MPPEQQQLQAAIAALEAQRELLGDAVVDASLSALRANLAALSAAAADEPAQQLKQVTILFLDVVGSTALSQRLDPEEVHAVMDDALGRFTRIVEGHQGKVLQYAGDSLLAVFGAEQALEDDAERAVRSGLGLLELGRTLGEEVLRQNGHAGFNVRVGIHTGGVLLGGGVDGEGTVRGNAVNIAARMEQTAPAGALRISHDTYAQVRGLFDVEPKVPLAVKGVDDAIDTFLVQGAKPRAFHVDTRGVEGVTTRMIGRDAEREALQQAFKQLFVRRNLAAVTVVAEAGIGKSRLLDDFDAWSETRPEASITFRGRCTPQTPSQHFGLLRDLLARHFHIADSDTIERARIKLEQSIVPLFLHDDGPDLAEGHAHLLGHLIGIDVRDSRHVRGILSDPRQIRSRALHAAAQLFRRLSAADGCPIVLQLEDLHWGDNESLDFLASVVEVNRDVPLLILSFARPTLFERRADWMKTASWHQRIDLKPLDKTGSDQFTDELLKKLPEIPASLRALITSASEGNPFYMEELVNMLIDRGAIAAGPERWTLNPDKLLATRVPTTLTGVLQARLDELPRPERQTLQEASVIGQVFWDQALIALDERARLTLPALVQRELALPSTDAAVDGLREYAFKHQILYQVTYDTVLKRTRRELHGKLAYWLTGLTGLRAKDFLGITAEHFEQAGDEASAAEYYTRAAEHAQARFAHDAMLGHVQRALALLDIAPQREAHQSIRWRLLDARERTLAVLGQRSEQRADIAALEALAETADNDRQRAHVAIRRAILTRRLGDMAAQEPAARRAVMLAERAGADDLRLLAKQMLAYKLAEQGDQQAGAQLAQQCLAEARALGLHDVEAACLNTLAAVAELQDDLVIALDLHRQALALSQEAGNRLGEATALGNAGLIWMSLGELTYAQRDLEACLRLVRANGDRAMECFPLCPLSRVARWQGDDARALALAQAALKIAIAVEARDFEVTALLAVGAAELALGHHAAAVQSYEQARSRAQSAGSSLPYGATIGLAQAALAQHDVVAAMQHVEGLLVHSPAGGDRDFDCLTELTCHQVLAQAGDARATEWLQRAFNNLQSQAASITDATLRQSFLTNIPEHLEIMSAWRARHTGEVG